MAVAGAKAPQGRKLTEDPVLTSKKDAEILRERDTSVKEIRSF